jgi:hypothetical protein
MSSGVSEELELNTNIFSATRVIRCNGNILTKEGFFKLSQHEKR